MIKIAQSNIYEDLWRASLNDIEDIICEIMFFEDIYKRHIGTEHGKIMGDIIDDLNRELKSTIKHHEKTYKDKICMKEIRKALLEIKMTKDDAVVLILEIEKLNYKPNAWEEQFMESVGKMPNNTLSIKQSKMMSAIYANASGGGLYQNRRYV